MKKIVDYINKERINIIILTNDAALVTTARPLNDRANCRIGLAVITLCHLDTG